MKEYQATGNVTNRALQAAMSRPTARKHVTAAQPPQELQTKHHWRTRQDPLVEIWPQAEALLAEAPELEAKALFEHLWERSPWAVQAKHLRTFQRRVQRWRLAHGADREVFFPQDWEAGRALQLDWTNADELGITITGEPYAHLLCHCVLPHSNWEWATRCRSESLLSLRQGLQAGLHRLGKVPQELRVDNSSAATHRLGGGETARTFNEPFASICAHYGLVPRTIGIGCPNENGDVESSNGHLKRRLHQHLLLRGSREFAAETDYEHFLERVLERSNQGRREKLAAELAVMTALPPTRLSEYDEVICRVGSASTIRVKKVGCSVPARLIGQELKVEVYERELKLYSGRELLLSLPRHTGNQGMGLDYRHVIDHLLRKPGAFERYRYREQMFPSRLLRTAYDHLIAQQGQRRGTVEYLRLLKLTIEVGTNSVEVMLADYLSPPYPMWSVAELQAVLQPVTRSPIELAELQPEWRSYDALLSQEVAYAN